MNLACLETTSPYFDLLYAEITLLRVGINHTLVPSGSSNHVLWRHWCSLEGRGHSNWVSPQPNGLTD
jgi:hypothetical protein